MDLRNARDPLLQENELDIKQADSNETLTPSDGMPPIFNDESDSEDDPMNPAQNENNSHVESKSNYSSFKLDHSNQLETKNSPSQNSGENNPDVPISREYTENGVNGPDTTFESCDEISVKLDACSQPVVESFHSSPDPGYESALVNSVSPSLNRHTSTDSPTNVNEFQFNLPLASGDGISRSTSETDEMKSISSQPHDTCIPRFSVFPNSERVHESPIHPLNANHDNQSNYSIADLSTDSGADLAAAVLCIDDSFRNRSCPESESFSCDPPTSSLSPNTLHSSEAVAQENCVSIDRSSLSSPTDHQTIQTTANIDLDIQVIYTFNLKNPQDVENLSKDILKTFIAERCHMELSAKSNITANTSSASASTSATVNVDGQTSIGGDQTTSDNDPVVDLINSLPQSNPDVIVMSIARNLAEMGDEINQRYGSRLDQMIKLIPNEEHPFEAFCDVARVLLNRRPTSWGQLIALFYFGYRLFIQRVRQGIKNALLQVVDWLIGFCRQLNIFDWIAQQGGWSILRPSSPDERNTSTTSSSDQLVPRTSFVPDSILWNLGWIIPLATVCYIIWKRYRR